MTLTSWQEALDLPGAGQMKYLKELMEEVVNSELKPDQSIIMDGESNCGSRIFALSDKSFAFFYIPTGNKIKINIK